MEWISWSVHFSMESVEKPVQNTKKRRSQSDKVGRLKYTLEVLKRIENKLDSFDQRLTRIEQGLKPSFVFEQSYIEEVACADEVDQEILGLLFEAGSPGLLPKVLAARLERFRVRRFQVSRRTLRMNKRLKDKLGECVAEQRGWHWALTGFARDAWGGTKKDLEVENEFSGNSSEAALAEGEKA
jgi:hypothetical protein